MTDDNSNNDWLEVVRRKAATASKQPPAGGWEALSARMAAAQPQQPVAEETESGDANTAGSTENADDANTSGAAEDGGNADTSGGAVDTAADTAAVEPNAADDAPAADSAA